MFASLFECRLLFLRETVESRFNQSSRNTASIGRLHRTSWMEFIGFSLILSSLLIGPAVIGGVGTVLVMQAGGLIVVFDRAKKRRSEDSVLRGFRER